MKQELELYIHIPFCVRKCAYCDFLSGPADNRMIEQYTQRLICEIKVQGETYQDTEVITIFFGGGTPSILSGSQMQRIMGAIKESFVVMEGAEISMEVNPGTVTEEKLIVYKKAGINRISFGLQSTDNEELKKLGRIHTYEEFLESYQMARRSGFDNMNVDLISAIPNQTVRSWEKSVRQVAALWPEHISAYSLIIEEGTPFADQYGEGSVGEKNLPSEEDERLMYQRTEEILTEAGYCRYEISNYAKAGKACRHNMGYWERKNYLGMGLGASSLVNNVRFKNTENMELYLKYADCPEKMQENVEILSQTEQMEEMIFLGLRKMRGISLKEFEMTFGKTLEECYGKNIAAMESEGLLDQSGGYLRLTKKGIDISNYVFAEILK